MSKIIPWNLIKWIIIYGEANPGTKPDRRYFPNYAELARRFDCTRAAVQQFAKKNGLQELRTRFLESGAEPPTPPPALESQFNPFPVEPPIVEFEPETEIEELHETKRNDAKLTFKDINDIQVLLVFGEQITRPDGSSDRHFPTNAEIAKRYAVTEATISRVAKRYNCRARHDENMNRIQAIKEQRISTAIAEADFLGTEFVVGVIDEYIRKFQECLAKGEVRVDNPNDFNTMVRLRQFLLGGSDSRLEVMGNLTLDVLQERFQRHLLTESEIVEAELIATGEVSSDMQEAEVLAASSDFEDEGEWEEDGDEESPEGD